MFECCNKDWLPRKGVGGVWRFNDPRDESLDACNNEREYRNVIRAEAIASEEVPQNISLQCSQLPHFFGRSPFRLYRSQLLESWEVL